MNVTQLKKIVKQGESEALEFKASTANMSTGMQTVCAFLNSDEGGLVIFGVKDDGKLIGQAVSDKTKRDIAIEINKIEPHANIHIDVTYLPVATGRQIIVISAHPGERAPYTYDGRAFMRNQSTTMRMTHEVFIYLYNKSNPTIWEKSTNNNCAISDLDKKRIHDVVRTAIKEKRLTTDAEDKSIPSILKKLDLTIEGKPTNAAVILFCKDEDRQFMQSTVQLARFRGTTKSEFLNQKLIKGNAFELYDKAMDFMIFSMPVGAKIVAGQAARVETPAIPYAVLREALINALIHRDYSHPGANIAIAVYDDRITITNPGFLPKGVNVRQLSRDHRSIQRNPLIANIFYLCGKIERWGRGTLDMIRECKNADNSPPKFEEIGGGFSVTLKFKEPMRTIIEEESTKIILTDRQKKILSVLEQGPLNRPQIMAKLRLKITDRTMQIELGKLKQLGLINSIGESKATVWFLTKK